MQQKVLYQIDLLEITRKNMLDATADFSPEQLNLIPPGFSNNLAWQLGHVLVTQQLLQYGLSNNTPHITNDLIQKYRKGTRPDGSIEATEIQYIREQLTRTTTLLRQDFEAGIFTDYKTYSTSYNATLHNIEEAITFNNLHEAMHLGYIMSIRKFV